MTKDFTCWQDSALDSLVAARHAVLADLAGGRPGGSSADAGTPMGHQVAYLITYMSQKGYISTGIGPFLHQATPMRHEGILLIMSCNCQTMSNALSVHRPDHEKFIQNGSITTGLTNQVVLCPRPQTPCLKRGPPAEGTRPQTCPRSIPSCKRALWCARPSEDSRIRMFKAASCYIYPQVQIPNRRRMGKRLYIANVRTCGYW